MSFIVKKNNLKSREIEISSKSHISVIKTHPRSPRRDKTTMPEEDSEEDESDYEWTPLMAAIVEGHEGVVRELLAAGFDKNEVNQYGHTLMGVAAYRGHAGVMRQLLAAGCDKDKANEDGETPLFLAANSGKESVVSELLAAGCDIDKPDKHGYTPLFTAALNCKCVPVVQQKQYSGVVQQLLAAGCDMDATRVSPCLGVRVSLVRPPPAVCPCGCRMSGATAVFVAACQGSEDIVEQLLKAGCNWKKATHHYNETPLDIAKLRGNFNVVRLLQETYARDQSCSLFRG